MSQAPCRTNGDDEHNNTCPFCGALPQAKCRWDARNAAQAAEDAEKAAWNKRMGTGARK